MFLAFSTAYGYVVQFKIFSLSVGFGLFHGLVFLPVVLNLLGGGIGKVTNITLISFVLTDWYSAAFAQSIMDRVSFLLFFFSRNLIRQ